MHCSFQLPADLSCHSIGDVSCVLARTADTESSAVPKAIVLTKEHKALFPAERKRIEKAGGMVTNGRLQGKPSNPIGRTIPHLHKRHFVTATPVTEIGVRILWQCQGHQLHVFVDSCGLTQSQFQAGGGVVFLRIYPWSCAWHPGLPVVAGTGACLAPDQPLQ